MKRSRRKVTGLVLDVDDTLYLERDYVASGFEAVGVWVEQKLGVAGFGGQAWSEFSDGHRGDVFDRSLAALGVEPSAELVAGMVACYRQHLPSITLLPDAVDLLSRAVTLGMPIAIITDGPAISQWSKIRALGIEGMCDPIVVTDDWSDVEAKPDPSAFLLVQESWDVDPSELVYVGDNPGKDFRAPNELGWRTLRVRRAGGLHSSTPGGFDVQEEVASFDAWDLIW